MSDEPAALKATFSNLRLIPSRKVCQIWLEIPIEGADAALAALGGIPQPQSDRWVAVARLNNEAKNGVTYGEFAQVVENAYYKTHPEEAAKRTSEPEENNTKLSLQAVMRCKELLFWRFLNTQTVQPVEDETDAAWVVRQLCGVESRSGLNTDPNAAALWRGLDAKFQAWKRGME
jgi:hypothetical protein